MRNRILDFIDNLGLDKKNHHVLGQIGAIALLGLFMVGCLLSYAFGLSFEIVVIAVNIIGVLFILSYAAKELIEDFLLKRGKPEYMDFVWNAIPVLTVLLSIDLTYWVS